MLSMRPSLAFIELIALICVRAMAVVQKICCARRARDARDSRQTRVRAKVPITAASTPRTPAAGQCVPGGSLPDERGLTGSHRPLRTMLQVRNSARFRSRADGRNVAGIVRAAPAAKHGGTRYKRIGARSGQGSSIVARDAAVNLEPDRPVADHASDARDLLELGLEEGLAAKTRIDRHHQDEIETIEHVIDRAFGSGRTQADTGLLAERADGLERAIEVRTRFGMHRNEIRARLRERFEIGIGRRDHEMHIEYFLRQRPDRLDDVRAITDVRDEMPVHDVAMNPVGARRVDRRDLLAEAGKIRSQDRRRDEDFSGHGFALPCASAPPLKTRLARTSMGSIVSRSAISSIRSRSDTSRSACRRRMRSTALRIERALEKNG